MIISKLEDVTKQSFEAGTGWAIKPQGACKDERCVPLGQEAFDVRKVTERLGMAVVHDAENGLYAIGPESGGRALASAIAPDFTLPEWRGGDFTLSSLRGQKALLLAWASW